MTYLMTGTKSTEPVALGGALNVVILAVLAVLNEFDVADLSESQQSAVLGLAAAVVAVVTWWQRRNVTPVA